MRNFLLLSLLVAGACTVFDTREPELPGQGTGSAFTQPDRPEVVIENLKNAIKNLSLQNYRRCLSNSNFEYFPTARVQNNNPDLWSNWSIDDEEAYFNNLKSASENFTGHQLQLEILDETTVENTRQITANYNLTMVHNRSSSPHNIPTVAAGQMRLTLSAGEDGLWSIESWTDLADGDRFSWSDMRATFIR